VEALDPARFDKADHQSSRELEPPNSSKTSLTEPAARTVERVVRGSPEVAERDVLQLREQGPSPTQCELFLLPANASHRSNETSC
jgi:hypothetical protein